MGKVAAVEIGEVRAHKIQSVIVVGIGKYVVHICRVALHVLEKLAERSILYLQGRHRKILAEKVVNGKQRFPVSESELQLAIEEVLDQLWAGASSSVLHYDMLVFPGGPRVIASFPSHQEVEVVLAAVGRRIPL